MVGQRSITSNVCKIINTRAKAFYSFLAQIEKSIARKEPKYNHLRRTNTNQREIKK